MNDQQTIAALSALANEHRLRIFRLLVKQGPSGLVAGEISAALDIPPTGLSFHLKELYRADLVISSRQGRYIRYAVKFESMRNVLVYLSEDCCQGHPEICGSGITALKSVCADLKV